MFDGPIQQGASEARVAGVQSGQKSAKDLHVTVAFRSERELPVPQVFGQCAGHSKAAAKRKEAAFAAYEPR
jgi:hypothetical protein